ncbi:MAG: DUF115 domain-containing protein [Ignavibacteriales bacterium]|nr:DUF115 domain-containing protein [Ignavibacteriales bacterium]
MSRIEYLRTINSDEINFTRIFKAIKRRILDLPHKISWSLPLRFQRKNISNLMALKDSQKGKRCFIIANGPSIKSMDLRALKNEVTIGMNRIYLLKEQLGFLPTYLVVNDVALTLKQFPDELANVKSIKLYLWNGRKYFKNSSDIIYFKQTFKVHFSENFSRTIYGGHSVTYACLQLAYYLGCDEVILIGKDHNYVEKGIPGKTLISTGKENNHFITGYYKKGMKWEIPDYKGEELAYKKAKEHFGKNGKKILDATVDGNLNIFEKIEFGKLFK